MIPVTCLFGRVESFLPIAEVRWSLFTSFQGNSFPKAFSQVFATRCFVRRSHTPQADLFNAYEPLPRRIPACRSSKVFSFAV